jgi:hypothetical protein
MADLQRTCLVVLGKGCGAGQRQGDGGEMVQWSGHGDVLRWDVPAAPLRAVNADRRATASRA